MKKYNLYVGLNDKDTKTQKIDTVEAFKIASNIVVKMFGAGTIYTADGIYTHENDEIVIEKTLNIEILTDDSEKIKDIINILKLTFNQESILKQTQTIEYDFI